MTAMMRHIWSSTRAILKLGFENYSCNWGTDIAFLYEEESEIDKNVIPMLKEGIASENRQYCILSTGLRKRFNAISNSPNQILFVPDAESREVFSNPDLRILINKMDTFYNECQAQNQVNVEDNIRTVFENQTQIYGHPLQPIVKYIRSVLDTDVIFRSCKSINLFEYYIHQTNQIVESLSWLQLTLYNLNLLPASYLIRGIRNQRFIFYKSRLFANPFCQTSIKKN